MRGNEFLDKMALVDPEFIEAADAMPKKKKPVWTRWAAAAACMCLVAVGTVAALGERGDAPEFVPVPNPDGTIQRAEMPEEFPEHPILRPGDEGYIAPAPTPAPIPEPMPEPTPAPGEDAPDTHAPFLPSNVTEIPNLTPHISRFGEMPPPADMSVDNGAVFVSQPLRAAMEHYGDTVNYHVMVEFFRDGVQISAGGEDARAEADRLYAFGYTTAMETVRQEEEAGGTVTVTETYFFSLLTATREQIENFPASEDLGYSLRLYGEYFGEDALPDTVVFNSADRVYACFPQ